MSLCHNHVDNDISKMKKVMLFVFLFMCVEIWGHWHSNSLSLLADSIHLFVDTLSFLVSIVSLYLSKKKPTSKMTFGYYRFEAFGAIISILFIWIATIYLVHEAYHRFKSPQYINSVSFMIVSSLGFLFNIVCLFLLRKNHSHYSENGPDENLNMKAAYIHVIGDIIQSFGVLLAGLIVFFFPKLVIFDIICTLIFAFIVLLSTLYIIKDAVSILLEEKPKDISIIDLKEKIENIEDVIKVEDLYVWSLSVNVYSIMIKILCNIEKMERLDEIKIEVNKVLKKNNKLKFINVEINRFSELETIKI